MNNQLALVVNTHSSCSDLWKIFYDRINLYFSQVKNIYFFTDTKEDEIKKLNENINVISYHGYDNYRDQFYYSIKQVKEKYIIYTNEDYLLYDYINYEKILELLEILNHNEELSFIKLVRGPESIGEENKYKNYKNLYNLENNENFYSMVTTIWKTKDKEKIYQFSPAMHIADKGNMPQFESHAHKTCKILNIKGCVYYEGEDKRGMYHYDSNIFPHTASALVKGKWNIKEYANELYPIIKDYNIDVTKRGIF